MLLSLIFPPVRLKDSYAGADTVGVYALAQMAQGQTENVWALSTVFKWGLLCAGALVAVAVAESVRRHGLRDRQIKSAASRAGMQYNDGDAGGIASIRFDAFSFAKRIKVSNVVTVKNPAIEARAFDFQSYDVVRSSSSGGGGGEFVADLMFGMDFGTGDVGTGIGATETAERTRHVFGKTRSGAVVKVHAYLPPMSIMPANFLTRAFERVAEDIDFESDEFNRDYDVRCRDKRFAWLFLDAQMIDFVLSFGGKMAFETFGNYVLCFGKVAEPDELPRLAQRMSELPSVMNALVFQEYPTTAGIESRDALAAWQARPGGARGTY